MGFRYPKGKGQFCRLSIPLTINKIRKHCETAAVYAGTAEAIEMPFGELTHVGPRNHVVDGQGRRNPFVVARGDNMTMRPFVRIL